MNVQIFTHVWKRGNYLNLFSQVCQIFCYAQSDHIFLVAIDDGKCPAIGHLSPQDIPTGHHVGASSPDDIWNQGYGTGGDHYGVWSHTEDLLNRAFHAQANIHASHFNLPR